MASNDSVESGGGARDTAVGRRKAARYAVPVAVAGVAAATIGLVPALANTGDPELPEITAQQLIEKIAASDTQRLSGTVRISTDLGIPSFGGLVGSFARGADSGGSTADPRTRLAELASGTHTLRVAADGPDRQRLSVVEDAAEYRLIHDGDQVWAYDSGSHQAYHATGDPAGTNRSGDPAGASDPLSVTPKALAEQVLKAAGPTTSVTVDGTAQVAGRDAYKLLIKPRGSGSTIGSVTVAVDAKNGVPLKFTLLARSGGKAVVDAGFTEVDFAKPAASSFTFTPPEGTEVTEAGDAKAAEGADAAEGLVSGLLPGVGELGAADGGATSPEVIGEGWNTIVRIGTPDGAGRSSKTSDELPALAQQFLDSLGDQVTGEFGSGTVFRTRLINALMTDDGTVYLGAVTPHALVEAADDAG
ncbi:DUF2092 domain-containing protein [Streptomyces sp. NPDC052052]|uniref:LolA family protein n=1 Tax=Streptomyces sp. NPDC052052 TaxID=3154756 RepID=UPI00342EAD9E